jgi:hypothetical protein
MWTKAAPNMKTEKLITVAVQKRPWIQMLKIPEMS